jgi:type IV secretory pathway VirB10-like protein
MNRRRQRPLRRRLKTQPSGSGQRQDGAKALIKRAAPGALLALCVAMAIGFGLFFLFAVRNTRPKNSGITTGRAQSESEHIVSTTTPSPLPVEKESRTNPAPPNQDPVHSGTILAEDSAHDQSPVPTPVPTAAPLPQPTAIVSDNRSCDLKRSEVDRKSVERERREAERKRSRLEAMYRKHEISSEAYKKGQDEYKNEIAKYRNAVGGAESTNE